MSPERETEERPRGESLRRRLGRFGKRVFGDRARWHRQRELLLRLWRAARPGDEFPAPLPLYMLRGSSSVGKSHLLRRIAATYPEMNCVEMDRTLYWLDGSCRRMVLLTDAWLRLRLGRARGDRQELFREIRSAGPAGRLVRTAVVMACFDRRPLALTGGCLPDVGSRFFQLLQSSFRVQAHGVALLPSPEEFRRRLWLRNPERCEAATEERVAHYRKRWKGFTPGQASLVIRCEADEVELMERMRASLEAASQPPVG